MALGLLRKRHINPRRWRVKLVFHQPHVGPKGCVEPVTDPQIAHRIRRQNRKIYALDDSSLVLFHLVFLRLWLYRQVKATIKKIGREARLDQNKDAPPISDIKRTI